jgi:Uma2 family endonuclease
MISAMTVQSETMADLLERMGNVAPSRIRMHPAPGTALVEDVLRIHDQENRLFELVDGVLVEKVMGFLESAFAMEVGRQIGNFAKPRDLGIILGADGMVRLFPNIIRIPDVAFIAWNRLPGGKFPTEPIPTIAPNLAIEILSESNTKSEMKRKRVDYFGSGVELVWEFDCNDRTVTVYTAPEVLTVLTEKQILTGGPVLPEFQLNLSELFAEFARRS